MSMALDLRRQALSILGALLLGLALGLAYDLLRPPREGKGRLLTALLDALFCLTAAIAAFLYAMRSSNGRLGFWELTASFAGFLLYLHLFSPVFLPYMQKAWHLMCTIIDLCKKFTVKCQISAKKNFQKVRKCFIVKR